MNLNDIMGKKDGSGGEEETKKTAPPADEGAEVTDPPTEDGEKTGTENTSADDKPTDPYADWTKEQLAEEMKKTRAEAAKNRVEKKQVEENLEKAYEDKLKALEDKFTPFIEKAKKFDKMKEEEADKKRTLEEKLADREAKIEALAGENTALQDKLEDEKRQLQMELEKRQAEVKAYETYWSTQLEKELNDVPEKHKNLADMIVKGAGDTKEALEAIRQAKAENVFGNKKVSVYHATPTAKDGARLDADKAQKQASDKLNKKEKVREGLKKWKDVQRRRLRGE